MLAFSVNARSQAVLTRALTDLVIARNKYINSAVILPVVSDSLEFENAANTHVEHDLLHFLIRTAIQLSIIPSSNISRSLPVGSGSPM